MLTNILLFLVAAADPTPAKADAAIKMYALDCGHLAFADAALFSDTGDYDGQAKEFIAPCFLIRHPKGDFLFDAGLGDANHDKTIDMGWVKATVPVTLLSQLKQLGMGYEDIEYFAFSHSHLDHIGNANALTKATWIVSPREIAYAKELKSQPANLLAGAAKAKKVDLEGDHDVFGDGTVKLLRAPGHTPDHHVLLVKLPKTGYVILSGDLAHQRESYELNRIPAHNFNRADSLASLDRVKRLAQKLPAKVIIEHDVRDFLALPKFPEALE